MRIAYLCDGTWNDPGSDTNVFRLFHGTSIIPGQQDALYDDGVGADGNEIDKLLGGALGAGLTQKVKDGYSRIAHIFTPGDDLFLFGFSRGAYTARCIAGMIGICGLPTQNVNDECVDTAWQAYRDTANRAMLLASMTEYAMDPTNILMVGVWDTVGSLGIPAAWGGINEVQYGFLDTTLNPKVLNAYQALAINEERAEFPPTLWTSASGPTQVVDQAWFAGVHCDVGGGYVVEASDNGTRLADMSLAWMLERAQLHGLVVDPAFAAQYTGLTARYALNTIHNSRVGIFDLPLPRPVPRKIPPASAFANSVAIRCQFDATYVPGTALMNARVLDAGYNISRAVADVVLPGPPAF